MLGPIMIHCSHLVPFRYFISLDFRVSFVVWYSFQTAIASCFCSRQDCHPMRCCICDWPISPSFVCWWLEYAISHMDSPQNKISFKVDEQYFQGNPDELAHKSLTSWFLLCCEGNQGTRKEWYQSIKTVIKLFWFYDLHSMIILVLVLLLVRASIVVRIILMTILTIPIVTLRLIFVWNWVSQISKWLSAHVGWTAYDNNVVAARRPTSIDI